MFLGNSIIDNKGYICAFLLASLTTTLIQFNIPLLGRDWVVLLLSALFIIGIKDSNNRVIGRNWLIVYVLTLFLNYVSGDNYFGSFSKIVCEVLLLYVSVGFLDYARRSSSGTQRLLLLTFAIVLCLTSIGTYIAESRIPGIVRQVQSAIAEGKSSDQLIMFGKIGMSNYSLPHALPTIIPVFVLILKESKISKKIKMVCIFALVSSVSIIFYTGATTPVLIMILAFVFSIFLKNASISKNIPRLLFLLLLFLFLLVTKGYLAEILQYFAYKLSSQSSSVALSERLVELHDFLLYGETGDDLDGRMTHYSETASVLNANIILGVNDDSYGGHSALFDRLAVLGIVGVIPFMVFLWMNMKNVYCLLGGNYKICYLECVIIATLTIMTKNMFSREFCLILLMLMPLSLLYIQNSIQKKN